MKKAFLFAAVAVMVAVSAGAQNFNKGDWFLGAQSTGLNLNYSFGNNTSYNNSKSLNLNAVGGYFITDRLAVDGIAGFNWSKVEGSDNVCGFGVGAGFRYYPVSNLYGRAGYMGVLEEDNWFRSYLKFEVGYDIFVSEKVFFEPAVYYSKEISHPEANGLGLSLGIGVRF